MTIYYFHGYGSLAGADLSLFLKGGGPQFVTANVSERSERSVSGQGVWSV